MFLLKVYTQEDGRNTLINQENSALAKPQINKEVQAGQSVEQGEGLQRDMGKDSFVFRACPASTSFLPPLDM